MDRRRLVVVEDDPMTRGLIAQVLEVAGFAVATASNGSDARRAVEMTDPDGVLLDVDLGLGPTGFDVADALLLEFPHLAVIFLTHLPDSRFAGRAPASLPKGAAYLHKEQLADPKRIAEAVDSVLRGTSKHAFRDDLRPDRPLAKLSQTQISVLRMVALGLSNQQIAERRGTTVRAVADVITRALEIAGVDPELVGSARVAAAREYMVAAGLPLAEL